MSTKTESTTGGSLNVRRGGDRTALNISLKRINILKSIEKTRYKAEKYGLGELNLIFLEPKETLKPL